MGLPGASGKLLGYNAIGVEGGRGNTKEYHFYSLIFFKTKWLNQRPSVGGLVLGCSYAGFRC